MLSEGGADAVTLPAIRTSVGTFAGVQASEGRQVEVASAILAAEGSFARVSPMMAHQCQAATEALPAFLAGVRCLIAPIVPWEWGSPRMGPWGPLLAGGWGFHWCVCLLRSILLPFFLLLD